MTSEVEAYDRQIRRLTNSRHARQDMVDYLTELIGHDTEQIDYFTQQRDEALGRLAMDNVLLFQASPDGAA